MCIPNLDLYTFTWPRDPNWTSLDVQSARTQKCVDWGAVEDWSKRRQIPLTSSVLPSGQTDTYVSLLLSSMKDLSWFFKQIVRDESSPTSFSMCVFSVMKTLLCDSCYKRSALSIWKVNKLRWLGDLNSCCEAVCPILCFSVRKVYLVPNVWTPIIEW